MPATSARKARRQRKGQARQEQAIIAAGWRAHLLERGLPERRRLSASPPRVRNQTIPGQLNIHDNAHGIRILELQLAILRARQAQQNETTTTSISLNSIVNSTTPSNPKPFNSAPSPLSTPLQTRNHLPLPPTRISYKRVDYPDVPFWTQGEYDNHLNTRKGLVNGLENSKPKRGRPKKSTNTNQPVNRHPYITTAEGATLTDDRHDTISKTGYQVFQTLKGVGFAPKRWKDIRYDAAQYFYGVMRANFVEFCYCDDDWKLELWATKRYSGWYREHVKKVVDDIPANSTTTMASTPLGLRTISLLPTLRYRSLFRETTRLRIPRP
ncbi:hypothetical protein BDN72DRAFT_525439 [Pluteus cervinus]|uniref:Uncharacterized protein n=1 Tax=Pluteus cervinus TaxID=181527 RepID=A0ACD3AXH9_9AGAR|nr:hypothetical protein BDN72DRAFT_525439 [Pluteus cervinus]